MVLDHSGLEEVAFFLEVDHLAHPRERVFFVGEQGIQTDLRGASVGDVAQVAFEHRSIQAQHATRHGVFGVAIFQIHGLVEQDFELFTELGSPEMGVFQLDGVDQVDAEIAVHGLIAQDVLVLLGGTGHLVLAAERKDLREADIEEQTFHQAGEDDQAAQQLLVVFHRAGLEGRIGEDVDERHQEQFRGGGFRSFEAQCEGGSGS